MGLTDLCRVIVLTPSCDRTIRVAIGAAESILREDRVVVGVSRLRIAPACWHHRLVEGVVVGATAGGGARDLHSLLMM